MLSYLPILNFWWQDERTTFVPQIFYGQVYEMSIVFNAELGQYLYQNVILNNAFNAYNSNSFLISDNRNISVNYDGSFFEVFGSINGNVNIGNILYINCETDFNAYNSLNISNALSSYIRSFFSNSSSLILSNAILLDSNIIVQIDTGSFKELLIDAVSNTNSNLFANLNLSNLIESYTSCYDIIFVNQQYKTAIESNISSNFLTSINQNLSSNIIGDFGNVIDFLYNFEFPYNASIHIDCELNNRIDLIFGFVIDVNSSSDCLITQNIHLSTKIEVDINSDFGHLLNSNISALPCINIKSDSSISSNLINSIVCNCDLYGVCVFVADITNARFSDIFEIILYINREPGFTLIYNSSQEFVTNICADTNFTLYQQKVPTFVGNINREVGFTLEK